ncbi:hypothetical protein N7478_003869 [Penicillium angulare]|uniref:uncharacterized protein n=1 Tax=Penicillium angulare TaxID=116970 RepID=UPI0025425E86|nr:uncharacterized protein N7478_003869 [Penicillium angulare]KAJ5288183.1 hypothetical protein N7478_003869 [Penicillium angulare]
MQCWLCEKVPICPCAEINHTKANGNSDLLTRHIRLSHENTNNETSTTDNKREKLPVSGNRSSIPVGGISLQDLLIEPSDSASHPNIPSSGVNLASSADTSDLNNNEIPFDVSNDLSLTSTLSMPWIQSTNNNFSDFAMFIDNMTALDGQYPSFFIDQPILDFSPAPLFASHEAHSDSYGPSRQSPKEPPPSNLAARAPNSTPHLFDEFGSSFPSFESTFPPKSRKEPFKVTQQDLESLSLEIQKYASVLPSNFVLPSRHTLTRYIFTYFSGFHRHLPMVHVPTFWPTKYPVELILAMSTIGALSAFDNDNTIMFFRASLGIAQERLRKRQLDKCEKLYSPRIESPVIIQCSEGVIAPKDRQFDPLPLAQTLLILLAMATWGNSKDIYNESIAIQNTLANYMRNEKLLRPRLPLGDDWSSWIQAEGFRRTITIIFCFFVFHTIVYDIPPPILNSELIVDLPSQEVIWEAQSETEWQEARKKHTQSSNFQTHFSHLFENLSGARPMEFSQLGGYILILALIQHIYLLRETSRHHSDVRGLAPADVSNVEQALKNWQSAWSLDPESYLGPGSSLGPISFNASALLRMAYMRLNVDLGPCRALNTHDPEEIALSMHQSPPLAPSRKLSRAVLYSAHALSIPVKIGVNIAARSQAFAWSLQHSLCALECAFVISKWLIGIQPRITEGSLDEEEARLLAYIADMVAEADPAGEVETDRSHLCTRVIKVWAKIFSGDAHWEVVRFIIRVLSAYGDILEKALAV